MSESTLSVAAPELVLHLFGTRDQNLQLVRDAFGVHITHRDGVIRIQGAESAAVALATQALEQLKMLAERRGAVSLEDSRQIVDRLRGDETAADREPIDTFSTGRRVIPRTPGQVRYVKAIRGNDLTIAVGPAGCGKTYLAVALAVEALKQQAIRKIVLVRPAVEAGESLGFLPGDLHAKINPYLRPLLDALQEMIDYDQMKRYMEQDVIEVIPLAYMRGRTLNEAFIILDEAQNTTVSQMKMFLTRMGAESKIVVSGDATQVDLPQNTRSGLIDALERLTRIKGVAEVRLSEADIVRHRLVQEIVRAYEDVPTLRRKR